MVNIPKFFKNQEGGTAPAKCFPCCRCGTSLFSPHGGAAFCRAQQIGQRALQCHEQGQAHFSGHPEKRRGRQPQGKDICDVGVIGTVLQLLRLPDGTVKALIEGTPARPHPAVCAQEDLLSSRVELFCPIPPATDH
jgi:ATP-dependent Lon protease